MIRVINLRSYSLKEGEVLVKVDRSSILGNPFYMSNESMRDKVCDEYETYFYKKLKDNTNNFAKELIRIYTLSLSKDIALGCWCYPKRCHGDLIKEVLDDLKVNGI